MSTLEEMLDESSIELGISPENQGFVRNYLSILKAKDEATYQHSVRVGVLGARIARHMHMDPKTMLFAGSLHDIGKILIDAETLKKTENFDDRDMEQIRKHPEYSHLLLKGVHPFSAEIVLRHHRYQEQGYPEQLYKAGIPFSECTEEMIDFYARLLALADFYDSATTRVNEKFGERRRLSPGESKSILLMENADQRQLIEDLYANGIFGESDAAVEAAESPEADDMKCTPARKKGGVKRIPGETLSQDFTRSSLEGSIYIIEKNKMPLLPESHKDFDPNYERRRAVARFVDNRLRERFYSVRTIYELSRILSEKQEELRRLKESAGPHEPGIITKRKYRKSANSLFSEKIHPFFSELVGWETVKEFGLPDVETETYLKHVLYQCGNKTARFLLRSGSKVKRHMKLHPDRNSYINNLIESFDLRPVSGGCRRDRIIPSGQGKFKMHMTYRHYIRAGHNLSFVGDLVHEEAHRYQTLSELLWLVPVLQEGHALNVEKNFGRATGDTSQDYFLKAVDYLHLLGTYRSLFSLMGDSLCSLDGHKSIRFDYHEFVDESILEIPSARRCLAGIEGGAGLDGKTDVGIAQRHSHKHRIGNAVVEIMVHKDRERILSDMYAGDYSALMDYLFE